MLTELWAPGLLGYLSHSRKFPAARKETWMTGRGLTRRSAAENKNIYVESAGNQVVYYWCFVYFSIICIICETLMFLFVLWKSSWAPSTSFVNTKFDKTPFEMWMSHQYPVEICAMKYIFIYLKKKQVQNTWSSVAQSAPPPHTHPLYVNLPATDGRWRNQQHVYFFCALF